MNKQKTDKIGVVVRSQNGATVPPRTGKNQLKIVRDKNHDLELKRIDRLPDVPLVFRAKAEFADEKRLKECATVLPNLQPNDLRSRVQLLLTVVNPSTLKRDVRLLTLSPGEWSTALPYTAESTTSLVLRASTPACDIKTLRGYHIKNLEEVVKLSVILSTESDEPAAAPAVPSSASSSSSSSSSSSAAAPPDAPDAQAAQTAPFTSKLEFVLCLTSEKKLRGLLAKKNQDKDDVPQHKPKRKTRPDEDDKEEPRSKKSRS